MSQEESDSRPDPPSWINKDLVETALRGDENDATISVLSCDVTMANAVGDGVVSDMYRVVAKLKGCQERRVVVKCQPQGGSREDFVQRTDVFLKESTMLLETLPAMDKLLDDAKPGAYPHFAAKCLYYGKQPLQYLVLEDLRQLGFTLAKDQMDLDHCIFAMKTLARFHASSIALLQEDPDALKCYQKPFYCEEQRKDMEPFFQNILLSLENIVLEWSGYEKYSSKIKAVREKVYDIFMGALKPKDDELKTLIHNDAWAKNMMFKYSDSNVVDIKLVDFQLCFYSSPAIDLLHFLSVCPNEEVRDNRVDELLLVYHNTFSEILDIFQCSQWKISLKKLKNALDDHIMYGFIVSAVYFPLMLDEKQDQHTLSDLLDENPEMINSWEINMRSKIFQKSLQKLLLKCEKLGVI